jgi:hypothetical protein
VCANAEMSTDKLGETRVIRLPDGIHEDIVWQFIGIGLHCSVFRAFDAKWVVPSRWQQTGGIIDTLCVRLREEGLLGERDGWKTGDTEHELIRHRPAFWKGISSRRWNRRSTDEDIRFWDDWDKNAPPIAQAGAWSYYIPKDVHRFLPPSMACPACGRLEDETWSPASTVRGYACSAECAAAIRAEERRLIPVLSPRERRKQQRERAKRRVEAAAIRTAKQKLREVRQYLTKYN